MTNKAPVQGENGMFEVLFLLYLINATLLILHEIDSAYWQEWKLFNLPGGITGFLLLHIPVLPFFMYGLIEVYNQSPIAWIFSLILSFTGIFAFSIHLFFIKVKKREEFTTVTSFSLLVCILILSIVQLIITSSMMIVT